MKKETSIAKKSTSYSCAECERKFEEWLDEALGVLEPEFEILSPSDALVARAYDAYDAGETPKEFAAECLKIGLLG